MANQTSPKVFIDNFKRNRPPSASLTEFLPFAAAFMSCIDGEVHESEVEKIHEVGKKFLGKNFNKKQLSRALKDLSPLLNGADETVLKKWEALTLDTFSKMNLSSEGEKQALLAFFCELAFADGLVHKKELRFIDKLSDAINFKNPFELVAENESANNQSKVSEWQLTNDQASGMMAKMLSDAMIKIGHVPEERKKECLVVASSIVIAHKEKTSVLLSNNKKLRRDAFLFLSRKIKEKL